MPADVAGAAARWQHDPVIIDMLQAGHVAGSIVTQVYSDTSIQHSDKACMLFVVTEICKAIISAHNAGIHCTIGCAAGNKLVLFCRTGGAGMCRAQEAEEAAEASGASEGVGSKCPCPACI